MTHTRSDFHFNPFAGISHEDLAEVIVPKPEVEALIGSIDREEQIRVAFLGKKGRGKTTHLAWLQTHFPQYPIYLLNNGANKQKLLKDTSQVLFIDSIHHLRLWERITLFQKAKSLIFTSHWPRKWEVRLVGKSLHTIHFRGIAPEILTEIIHKRCQYAAKQPLSSQEAFKQEEIKYWIRKYGDNYRGILNELYSKYQQHEHTL